MPGLYNPNIPIICPRGWKSTYKIMAKEKFKIIGIDVGGTKIFLQVFDENLNLIDAVETPTQTKKGAKGFINQLYGLIDQFFSGDIKGIGVAMPGIVDINKGILAKAPHLPTGRNFPIRRLIQNRYKVPVMADNDITAFLLAGKELPELKKYKNIIAIMVGTGLGGAIIANGQIVYGKNGYAGEVGHIVTNADGQLKTLEENTSGFYIPKIAKELGIQKKMTARDLEKNTPESQKIRQHLVKQLGIGLANLNLIFNPDAFVLGGSVYRLFISGRKKELEKIIIKHSLDKSSPKLIDASQKTSVAKGMAIEVLNSRFPIRD
jgi:glucokinase